ncbi:polyprenyl synthetase family protein [Corynebacterium callunae]|uniref:polyprenyl synthetase family protein n=1 Tax=Corynebacterium callunae TaxID=1721 RepID=UPI003982B8C4
MKPACTSSAVEKELSHIFGKIIRTAEGYHPSFGTALKLAALSAQGGKLLRPTLLIDLYSALSGTTASTIPGGQKDIWPQVVDIAAAIELLHFAFLIHDDVIDGDVIRRGRPNLISLFLGHDEVTVQHAERKEWASSSAILIGDLLLTEVHQIFARLNLPHHKRLALLDLLEHSITESIIGEFLDVGLSKKVISPLPSTVKEMSQLKTATYTFELPMCSAAILAGYSTEKGAQFADLAADLGLLFQLQDDFFSTFGDPKEHGKDELSDFREGKETLIVAFARNTASWPHIEPHFGNQYTNSEDVKELKELLSECGAEKFLKNTIAETSRACRDQILKIAAFTPAEVPVLLNALVDSLEGRRT